MSDGWERVTRRDSSLAGWLVRHVDYAPPLAWDALLRFFAARAVPGIEEVDNDLYRRSLDGGVVELRDLGGRIAVRSRGVAADVAERVARSLLDLDADPAAVADGLGADPLMAPLVAAEPGRRVPGCADGGELAIRAVLGQQITVAAARTLAARLVAAHGEPLRDPVGAVTHAFPSSAVLAAAAAGASDARGHADAATAWAMPASRRRTVATLAAALASGDVELDPHGDRERTRDRLLALPGVGPWTAGYVAMRALGDRDAFLPGDVGVRHALERLRLDPRPPAAEQLSQAWRPFRAYALQHLWAVAA